MKHIGFIGTGNMAGSIMEGIIDKGFISAENVSIYNRSSWRNEKYLDKYNTISICEELEDLVSSSKYIVVGVKPYGYKEILDQIKGYLTSEHVVISIAAGVTLNDMESSVGVGHRLVRTMPNTPALVGEGMTAITFNTEVTESEKSYICALFSQVGKYEIIDEKLMDFIPAVSGSSPAYVFMFIEAMADGAVLDGIPRDKAYRMAAQAVLGAAKMVLETGKHPGELKDMVTSPGGTTIEAIKTLETNGFRGTVMSAMKSCTDKIKNLQK